MTQAMREYAEKENAKPKFYASDGQVYQRGTVSYNEETGKCSQSFNVAICVITEFIDDDEGSEFIADALNQRQELMEVLQDFIDHHSWNGTKCVCEIDIQFLNDAKAAIKKVKGEKNDSETT